MPYRNWPTNIFEAYAHRTVSQRKRRNTSHKTNAWYNRHRKARRQAGRK